MTNEERKEMDVSAATVEALYRQYLIELGEDTEETATLAETDAHYAEWMRLLEDDKLVRLEEGGSGDEYQTFVVALGPESVAKRARQYTEQLQRDREEIAEANERHREEMMMHGGWEERLRRIRLGWLKRR